MKRNPLAETRKQKRERDERVHVSSSLKQALDRIEDLESRVEAIKRLAQSHLSSPIRAREKSGESEATAVAMATDWHFGARVRSEQVNGLNAFDVAIARRRIAAFFERVVRIIRKEQQDVKITDLVLFLGGDMINGSLHTDTMQSDEIAQPIEQSVECQALIEGGLNFLLNHARVKTITIPCCDGNHGRITQKQQWTSRQGNALEYYMYYNLAKRFPMCKWVFSPGLLIYQQIYGWSVRFHHGDTIHFGGIKGPMEYLTRAIFFWDTYHRADYTAQGHLHTYNLGTRRWLINGSLIGVTPFGIAMRGEFQPPIQAFFLVDKKRGPTVQIPILL